MCSHYIISMPTQYLLNAALLQYTSFLQETLDTLLLRPQSLGLVDFIYLRSIARFLQTGINDDRLSLIIASSNYIINRYRLFPNSKPYLGAIYRVMAAHKICTDLYSERIALQSHEVVDCA